MSHIINKICLVEDCNNLILAKGYCNMHYLRLRRHGNVNHEKATFEFCTVEGCEKEHKANGFCRYHYFEIYRKMRLAPEYKEAELVGNTTQVISISGGIGSYCTAKRVIEKYGIENCVFLFADTYIEDDDLYRFLIECIAFLNGVKVKVETRLAFLDNMEQRKKDIDSLFLEYKKLFPNFYRVADGRDVWQVIYETGVLNYRYDKCSQYLKREILWKWIRKRYKASQCQVHIGIDWSEIHRLEKMQKYRKPYRVRALLCSPPFISKKEMIETLNEDGIKIPNDYLIGFSHLNCGGFCIKGGQKNFKLLLEHKPEIFSHHEDMEKGFQEKTGRDNTVMLKMRKGVKEKYSLEEFRKDIEKGEKIDEQEYGGCGCSLD